jgi:ribosome-associated translation inhibitor RaiA
MQIQVNTDHNIEGHEELTRQIKAEVIAALSRFESEITRVEVHLSVENGAKSGDANKRCVMEARPAHHQPVAASSTGATLEEAYDGAAKKLHRLLESTLGRLNNHKGVASIRVDEILE